MPAVGRLWPSVDDDVDIDVDPNVVVDVDVDVDLVDNGVKVNQRDYWL